jgi:hypothetical protein
MARSIYDANGDGRCDAAACRSVMALSLEPQDALLPPVRHAFEEIGIHLHVVPLDGPHFFTRLGKPALHVAIGLFGGYFVGPYPSGGQFFPSPFSGGLYPLVHATPHNLRRWGYAVTSIPSVDDRIDQCRATRADAQPACWASLDKYLMEDVVPWVPYLYEANAQLVSNRVAGFSFDQSVAMPALDRIALKRST